MPHASRTVTIAAPIEKVFAFFTDPANEPSWRTGVKDIHAHGEPAVGAVIHQTIKGPLGRG
ncbi:MAG TPA: SRPBCC family protein, partial [Nocardioides sp.]|nr:SRPBCC family protein [Nocardioides sp.]